jgi:hypothetical protein
VQEERGKEVHDLGREIDLYVEISKFRQLNIETKFQLPQKPTYRYVRFRSSSTFVRPETSTQLDS